MELDVVIRNKQAQKLIGKLTLPLNKTFYPGIILCHGFTANKNSFFFPELSKELLAEGFAVLRFDARACGQSQGELHPTYKELVEDLKAAIEFMIKREDIEFLGLGGHSMGGTAAIITASQYEEVKAVISYAGVADIARSVKNKHNNAKKEVDHYTLTTKKGDVKLPNNFFTDLTDLDMFSLVKTLHKPIMFMHGVDDSQVSIEEATQLFLSASMPKSFKKFSDCDHSFAGHTEALSKSSLEFYEKYLQEKSSQKE